MRNSSGARSLVGIYAKEKAENVGNSLSTLFSDSNVICSSGSFWKYGRNPSYGDHMKHVKKTIIRYKKILQNVDFRKNESSQQKMPLT